MYESWNFAVIVSRLLVTRVSPESFLWEAGLDGTSSWKSLRDLLGWNPSMNFCSQSRRKTVICIRRGSWSYWVRYCEFFKEDGGVVCDILWVLHKGVFHGGSTVVFPKQSMLQLCSSLRKWSVLFVKCWGMCTSTPCTVVSFAVALVYFLHLKWIVWFTLSV